MTPQVRDCLDALGRGEMSIEEAETPLARALAAGELNRLELAQAVEVLRAAGHIAGREALNLLANVDRMTLVRPARSVHAPSSGADDPTKAYAPFSDSETQAAYPPLSNEDTQTKSHAPKPGAETWVKAPAAVPDGDAVTRSFGTVPVSGMGLGTTARAIALADSPYPSSSTLVIADESATSARESVTAADIDSPPTATRTPAPPMVERTEVIPPPKFERAEPPPARKSNDEAQSEAVTLRGRYRLEKLIGQGAMGQVWKAKDLLGVEARDRNPFVAIKVLRGDFARVPHALVGLHREASRAQKLAHPNVGTVYVLDRDEASGRAFIAMEMLDGHPLDKVIKQRPGEPMTRAEGIPIVRGMAEGLAYAHRRGIVHCDLKPANVFLTQDGVPKILDFGIARAVQVAGQAGAKLTTEHNDSVFDGYTPTYASPEMIADQEPVPADDVFSLGLVAYELLTGKHPFERKAADVAQKEGLVPEPISGLKRHEWRAIQKALAFDREQRWPDGAAFLKELQGRTPLQKTLLAALAASVIAAGVFGWQAWVETQPAVPFSSLPPAAQEEFHQHIAEGEQSLAYIAKTGDVGGSSDAAQYFAKAYAIHPKNREAVRGLKKAANYAIDWFSKRTDRAEARSELEKFRDYSDYYSKYTPINDAIAELN